MTLDPRSACSSSEVLGAFAEGRLNAEERAAVIAHLDTCDRCRAEVAALAEFVEGEAKPARRRPVWWVAAAAAVVLIAAASLFWLRMPRRDERPIASLVTASAALDHRPIEPRLDGFGWAAYRGSVRATEADRSPENLKVLGAAGEILQQADRHPTPEAEHAAGVASLFIAEPGTAIDRLNAALAKHDDDASTWNDLAAARYDAAVRLGRTSELPAALAAADHALKLDPRLASALFNRALILERMGVIEDARAAWKRYLEVDAGSPWAREARQRLLQLPPPTHDAAAFHDAAGSMDPAQLVARFPQQARAFTESEMLGRWGEAVHAGEPNADAMLARVRAIGLALRSRSGESLLTDSVQAIDDADNAQRTRFAEAHALYWRGRLTLSRHEADAARPMLLRAASLFGNDPAAFNARYFAAVAQHDGGHDAACAEELEALARDLSERASYKALHAQLAWELGLVEGSRAHWLEALARYAEAHKLFEELGETSNAAFIDALNGEASILLGRHDEAWSGWTRALRALSQHGLTDRLQVTLGFISRTESWNGHDAAAASILDLEIAHASGDAALRTDALFRRAMISAKMHDLAAAQRAVREGERAANGIADASARRQAAGDLQLAEGIAYEEDRPRALALLTAAVENGRTTRPLLLPLALRERARVLRVLGNLDEAASDLRAAAGAVEQQRGDVQWRDMHSAAIDGVDGIYVALAELSLLRGRTEEAFAAVDRAAAHAFYGATAARSAMTVDELRRRLGNDTVVEYLNLPRELLIFVVTARQVVVRRAGVDDVPTRVAALTDAIRKRGDVRAASLYPILVAPISDLIPPDSRITFVPDAMLQAVPFSALYNARTRRWLIEEHTIRLAPTALGGAEELSPQGPRIVVIQPPAPDLPSAATEAAAIARCYRRSAVVDGRSPAEVLAAMEDADVIHYAGHTESSGETGLALGGATLYSADIARLHLRAAPLVVLAGCRTLRGAGNSGDVATSLARAFLLAGARAVVGTAWDLNDRSAAALFARMHSANAADQDAATALRQAQLASLSDAANQPADWAAAEIIVRSVVMERRKS